MVPRFSSLPGNVQREMRAVFQDKTAGKKKAP
jgi:hypothetical protein